MTTINKIYIIIIIIIIIIITIIIIAFYTSHWVFGLNSHST